MAAEFSIFCGNASRTLADAVARAAGVSVGAATVGRFPDGEVNIEIRENVRDRDAFIIQSTA
jgi:ribose-phosphate pyrophosphokinase